MTGLAMIATISLGWSVYATAQDQPHAYLSTFTRLWEFAVGAMSALVVIRLGAVTRNVLGWLGLLAIAWAGWTYTDTSAFPGWIALLPVLGTVAVIVAGRGGPGSAGGWLSRRPVTFVGDISYSVYLIHWPLIVLLPAATAAPLTTWSKLAILIATVVLAWLSKTYVEDPLRTRALLAATPRRPFVFAAVGMAVVLVGVGATSLVHQTRLDRAEAATAALLREGGPCLGPRSLADPSVCGGVEGSETLVTPESLTAQASAPRLFRCQTTLGATEVQDCIVGEPGAPTTVALVGDSHAGMWLDAMDSLGRAAGFSVRVYAKSACPLTEARRIVASEVNDLRQESCEQWRADVLERVKNDRKIRDVVTSAFSSSYDWESVPGGRELSNPGPDGFVAAWKPLLEQGKRLHVLRDTPTPQRSVPKCLAAEADVTECNWPRKISLRPDVQTTAARVLAKEGAGRITLVDLTDQFCDRRTCYAQVGGIPVFRDRSHMSKEYSRLMAEFVASEVDLAY